MATKKKTKSPDDAPQGRVADQPAGGITISEQDAKVLDQSIDARMKALLKDHQEMGARPK